MSTWSESNSQYLTAAFHGLRLRLQRVSGDESVTPEAIAEAQQAIAAAAAVDPTPAAVVLSHRFNLSELEAGILQLCVAMEVDPLLPELCDRAQGGRGRAFPSFALAFQLFEEVRWEVISIDAPLRYWQLIQLHAPQPQPLPQTMLKADERIVNSIMGFGQLDHRLASLVSPLLPSGQTEGLGTAIAPSQQAVVADLCQGLSSYDPNAPVPIVQLLGADAQSKHYVAHQVAAQFGAQLYGLMGELIPTANQEFSEFLRLWDRETYLSPVALYIDTQEVGMDTPCRVALRRFLSHSRGLIFVDSREVRLPPNRQALTREVAKPTPQEQRQAWTLALGASAAHHPTLLTSQFNLNLDEIEAIAANVTGSKGLATASVGEMKRMTDQEQMSGTGPLNPICKTAKQTLFTPIIGGLGGQGDKDLHNPPGLGGRGANAELDFTFQGSSKTKKGAKGRKNKAQKPPSYLGTADSELEQRLWTACLNRTRPSLESLAQRLDTKATWEQLVLPEEAMGVLRQIVNQVRRRARVYDDWGFRDRMNRGLGVSAMFAGESGTGKTMAAEVIAKELNLHLYRIDLSAVVSKYIGETEKNLRRLFDAAEEGGAILFFDEADALFGKRSEVKDSHDRYANIEINYLLQRIESYRGLAILATNLKSSLDAAFLRRLRFLIDFPFPSKAYRQQLWRKAFPERLPTGVIDYEHLGQFNITGGTIHTIAINAAFMAAEQGEPVGMSQILASIRTEYQKLERQIYEADFQWDGPQRADRVWELSPKEAKTDV